MKFTKLTLAVSAISMLILAGMTGCGSMTKTNNTAQGRAPARNIPQTTIDYPGGGRITYGTANGATTVAAAMGSVLSWVHQQAGEKPQVGNVFRVRGSNSVAVFFTVANHNQGNEQYAGEVIASQVAPNDIEVGLVTDDANRFSSTMNPMLTKLFSVWNPGGVTGASGGPVGTAASLASASGSPAGANTASATGPAGAMHQVTLPDSTASVSIPAGWTVDPKSGGGGMRIYGTHGEVVALGNMFLAQDPNSPVYRSMMQKGMKPLQGQIVYPPNVDLVKALPDIIQLFRRSQGMGPADLKIDHAEQVSPPPGDTMEGEHCVQATGQVNPDGKGMQALYRMVCATTPHNGLYSFLDSFALFPNSEASQADAIASAIFASFKVNIALVTQRATAQAAPEIAHLKQVDAAQRQAVQANTARIVGNINQIGAQATARMNATEAANDAQHASFDQQENNISKNGQGFSNYLLDQSVVQNNANGTHSTQWNSQADAMVKSNPNRYEIVNTPNYWQGVDY